VTVARVWCVALVGVVGHLVEVEADLAAGVPGLSLVGLPDAALQEARDRVRAAIVNSGLPWPQRRMTVGLSPASLPKSGSGFDLALAAAILAADDRVPAEGLAAMMVLGELGLDGRVREIRGVLPAVLAAARAGYERVVVPAGNAAEAALVPGAVVSGVRSLGQLVRLLRGEPDLGDDFRVEGDTREPACGDPMAELDLLDVVGQSEGRRAVEVAAAGGHHLFLLGPPGAGKTMLAERMPGVLPVLDDDESLEVTAIHSVAGHLPPAFPLVTRAPFRNPHHTASVPALVGGGSGIARPGEVSLAHRGVLFLDEAPEFARAALDSMRQPLESGEIRIARAGGVAVYPARFQLVLAANPCPCATTSGGGRDCTCSAVARRRYLGRLSGPLLDRIDIRVELPTVSRAELFAERNNVESSADVLVRVRAARERASARLAQTPWSTNAEIPGPVLRRRWPVPRRAMGAIDSALRTGQLTARGMDRVLRVSWTLADLDGAGVPGSAHVSEAVGLRRVAA
jgi:magnesium chelatase family protein